MRYLFHDEAAPLGGEALFVTQIPSDLELMIPLVVRISGELLARGLIDECEREAIEAASVEALKNAILHGNRGNRNLTVSVRGFVEEGGWGVSFLDEGDGFDPAQISDPSEPAFPWLDHGRGIHLMSHVMDRVEFYSGGREVVLSRSQRGDRSQG